MDVPPPGYFLKKLKSAPDFDKVPDFARAQLKPTPTRLLQRAGSVRSSRSFQALLREPTLIKSIRSPKPGIGWGLQMQLLDKGSVPAVAVTLRALRREDLRQLTTEITVQFTTRGCLHVTSTNVAEPSKKTQGVYSVTSTFEVSSQMLKEWKLVQLVQQHLRGAVHAKQQQSSRKGACTLQASLRRASPLCAFRTSSQGIHRVAAQFRRRQVELVFDSVLEELVQNPGRLSPKTLSEKLSRGISSLSIGGRSSRARASFAEADIRELTPLPEVLDSKSIMSFLGAHEDASREGYEEKLAEKMTHYVMNTATDFESQTHALGLMLTSLAAHTQQKYGGSIPFDVTEEVANFETRDQQEGEAQDLSVTEERLEALRRVYGPRARLGFHGANRYYDEAR